MSMSKKFPWTRNLIAIAAALTVSTVAIGAAVGPAEALNNPLSVPVYA
jgi:hypothetical protein